VNEALRDRATEQSDSSGFRSTSCRIDSCGGGGGGGRERSAEGGRSGAPQDVRRWRAVAKSTRRGVVDVDRLTTAPTPRPPPARPLTPPSRLPAGTRTPSIDSVVIFSSLYITCVRHRRALVFLRRMTSVVYAKRLSTPYDIIMHQSAFSA